MAGSSRKPKPRERRISRRRRARAAGPLTWEELTPYQRWIIEAAHKEPRIPVPEGTREELVAWMLEGARTA